MQKEVILSRLSAIEKELKKRREGERNIAQYNKTKKHAVKSATAGFSAVTVRAKRSAER